MKISSANWINFWMQGFACVLGIQKHTFLMKLTCRHFRTISRMANLCWCWEGCRMVEMRVKNAWVLSSPRARIFNPYTDWFCLVAGEVLPSPMFLDALFPFPTRDYSPFPVLTGSSLCGDLAATTSASLNQYPTKVRGMMDKKNLTSALL